MVLIPLDQQCLLTYSSVSLNDEGLVFFVVLLKVEPFFYHEIVFLEPTAGLVFIES